MINQPFELHAGDRKLAVLIDPDAMADDALLDFIQSLDCIAPDAIMVGGSLVLESSVDRAARLIRATTRIPVVLFPGHFTQLTEACDAVLLLSLISGRNADLLIGQHVLAVPMLHKLEDRLIPTGYMLIDGGRPTSVSYMSNTQPVPADKPEIAVATALAGKFLGLRCIYLDSGSGAQWAVSPEMINRVATATGLPVIAGGGLRNPEDVESAWNAGASMVVIGNAFETDTGRESELWKYLTQRTQGVGLR